MLFEPLIVDEGASQVQVAIAMHPSFACYCKTSWQRGSSRVRSKYY
jgi:hypothetical protein